MTRLLIAGATGLVGQLVLEQALADERVSRVVALTRRPIASRDKLENVVIDFSDMPGQAAWWSVDSVVSALGTTRASTGSRSAYRVIDHDYPLAVARHARDHGATRFALVSSLGADPRSPFAYTRRKGELESELKKLGFTSLTIVRPSVLDGHRERERRDELMPSHSRISNVPGLIGFSSESGIGSPVRARRSRLRAVSSSRVPNASAWMC